MFWGSFLYNKKELYYIWRPETTQEKKTAEKELAEINTTQESECQAQWKIVTSVQHLGLHNKPGKALVWKFTKQTGKLVQQTKTGGIDWYQYE